MKVVPIRRDKTDHRVIGVGPNDHPMADIGDQVRNIVRRLRILERSAAPIGDAALALLAGTCADMLDGHGRR